MNKEINGFVVHANKDSLPFHTELFCFIFFGILK